MATSVCPSSALAPLIETAPTTSAQAQQSTAAPSSEPSRDQHGYALETFSLAFKDAELEQEYRAHYDVCCHRWYERVAMQVGAAAAAVQLLASYLGGKPATGGHMMLFNCLTPCIQRLYPVLLGKKAYLSNRVTWAVASRVVFVAVTAYQLHSTAASHEGAPLGDLAFRSGIGQLWWYNLVCPLMWKQYVPLQVACLGLHMLLLNGQTCSADAASGQQRSQQLRWLWTQAQLFTNKSLAIFSYPQLFAAPGALAAGGALAPAPGPAPCYTTLIFLQVALCLILPMLLMYGGEALCRRTFLLETRGVPMALPKWSGQDVAMFVACLVIYLAVVWEIISAVVTTTLGG